MTRFIPYSVECCGKKFRTLYGFRMHKLNVHNARIKLKRT